VGPVPPTVDLSAYRIVQEALTNALKHAGPARVDVRITHRSRELDVDVTDDGLGGRVEPGTDGKGLIGMRERVGLVDGTLSVGPGTNGGWVVHAVLPLEAVASR
jgi:signal transduction histidine kinase